MSAAPSQARGRRHGCPLCGKPPSDANAPFCSQGCRDRDLLNWLDGRYAIPAQETEADPDEADD